MAVDREAIFEALFTRLQNVAGMVKYSRSWLGWSQVSKLAEQPALFLTKGDERPTQVRGMPPRWELEADVIIVLTNASDPTVAPSTIINEAVSSLEANLQRQPTEAPSGDALFMANPDLMYGTTLGGLCTSVRFRDTITVEEGEVGQQSVIIAPLLITTAG